MDHLPVNAILTIFLFATLYLTCIESQSIPASTPVLSGSRFLTHAVFATFKCTSNGNPTPQISWKLGDQSILQGFTNNVVPLGNGADNVTSELTFLPIYADDGKILYCYSSQTGLTAPLSDSIPLSISYFPTVTVATRSYQVLSGTTVTLQCTVDSLIPLAEVYWRKTNTNGVVTTIDNNFVQSSNKYSGSTISIPSLTIFNADFSDVGSYLCYAQTVNGSGASSESTSLSIISVTVSSTQYSATEGDTITLQCGVQGLSTYSLNWYKDNQIVATGNGRYQNGNPTNPSLTINSVALSDAGNYICSAAIFSSSINSSLITLTVQAADSISVSLPTTLYNAFTSNSVTIACNIQTTSSVSAVYWAKTSGGNTQYIYTSTSSKYGDGTPNTPSLTIFNVNQNDAGEYVCYGVTSSGLTGQSSNSATLNVIDSLATIIVPNIFYTRTAGDSVTLDCNVNSNGQSYTVTWYFNGAIISVTGRFSGAVFGNPSLVISPVQASDAGLYICSATTSGGSSNSTTITLSVQQSASVSVPNLYYSERVGNDVILQCNVNSPLLSYIVSWYFNGALLSIFGRYSGAVFGNPSLRITNIQTTDAGPYICSATTSVASSNSSVISLVVQQVPLPTVSASNVAYTKNRGDLVTLECIVDNSGQIYSVTWYFNDAILDITGRFTGAVYDNPSLTVSSLHPADAGAYICSATNTGGSRNSSAISLTVLDPIAITTPNRNYVATVGNEIILQCDISTGIRTNYTVTWYFNGTVLGIAGRFSGAEFGNPSLKIMDIQNTDSGSYICSASSASGTTNSSIMSLSVQQALPVITVGAFFYQRTVGGSVTIECNIDASGQQYTVTWYRNNIILPTTTSNRYSGGIYLNPSLTISNILSTDAGTYICSATTTGGSVNSSIITLGVQDPPPTVSVSTNFYGPTVGDNITLLCNVDAYGQTYTVTWYFNGGLLPNSGRTNGGFFGNPSLTISNVQTSDTGTYICSAATSIGSSNSTSISVSVQQVVPTVAISALFYNPSIGETITLLCSVQASGSVYSVTWYYNNFPITTIGRYSGGSYGNPSLTISNIQSSDTGSYICSAATSAGSRNSSTISVNVQQVLPTVFAPTAFYQPKVGDFVTLDCTVTASGQTYSVTWYYNNAVVFTNSGRYSGAGFGNPSLTISNVQTSDTGSYICSAATSAGSRNSSAITLSVQQVLAVVTVNTNFYQPQVGETFTLDCSVQSSGQTYSVTWYYNNGFLATNTGRYSGGVYLNPSLTITNAQVSDTGSYICSATTSGGSRNSSTVSVNVQQVLPIVTATTNFYQPQANEAVTLECNVQASGQAYSVSWYYNNVIINTNSGRYSGGTFGNPSLTITSAQPSDTGSYICSAATSAGSRNASSISLNVQQILPTVSVSTFFYQPKVGDTVTLVCSVQASGQSYSVQWYYNNALLVTSGGRYTGAVFGTPSLTISNVQTSDTGSYICSAATSAGSRNASAISVNVQQSIPVVTVTTFFYQPKVGETVTLTCSVSVSGGLSYSVQWYYNNALLVTNTGRYSGAIFGTPSLTINNIQSSDTGSYICSAATSAGSRNGSAISVNVQQSLPVVTVTTFFYQPKVGETVTLACSVQASGQSYSVQWYYNNAVLLTSGGRYTGAVFGTPSLTITNVQSSDTGSYICSAATTAGSRNGSTISVNVQQSLPVVTVTTSFYQPKVGETVTLACSVQASGQSYSVQWYYNNAVLLTSGGRYTGAVFGTPSLTITNVQSSDTGSYICSAATTAGSRNGSTISVNVQQSLPVVTVTTFFYQPKVGETVTLACSVQASGQSYSVQWYYNNAVLLTSGGRYSGAVFGTPSLTITNVQSSDTGSYICSAATTAGSRNGSTISVNVQQTLPVVTVTTFFYQPKVGETVTLDCSVQASGQTYNVQWYYNNALLVTNTGRYSGAAFNNPSLTITNVQTTDTGSYICSAASTAGSRNGSTISLNVQQTLPVVTVTTFFYQPKVAETVTLDCSVQASGQSYSVQWYYNNAVLVTSGGRYSGAVFGTPSLTIINVQSSDTGSYICSAATTAGSRNGSTISVNVQQIIPTVTVSTFFYQPKLGETVTLDCTVQATNQVYTVQWYYNTALLTTNTGRYSGGAFGNPSLTITNAQLSDSGSYVCSAATSAGARNSSTVTLNVQATLPTVTVPSVYYNPRVTETVTIDCTVQASGQSYTVQWFYNNAILSTSTGRYSGGVSGTPSLTITNVQTSDSGSYICSAATSGGSRNSSTVSVSVQQVIPTVTVSSVFYNPRLSESVTLDCSVQASGQTYTVAWYYNNAILTTTSGRYTGATFSNPSLSISNVQLADSGSYICSAATSAGSRNSSSISLNVQSTLPIVTANTLFYRPKVAEAVTLECSVQASGQPYTVTWYYNSAVLNTNVAGYTGATSGTPSLTITNLQTSDSGSYVCSAATAAGSRNSSAILVTVQQILPTVSAPTLSYQPKVRESVTLDCTVQASGQLFTVTWYYNNGIIATNTGRYSDGHFGTPSLTISNLQTSDSGSYICSAATAAGSRNSSTISVTVQQILPSVTVPVNLYTPNYADSVTLNCNVDAFGQSYTVRWYYNNAFLSISGRYSGGSSGSPSLSISGLQMSDSGSYICSAATTAGSRNGSAISVTVQEILPVVTVSKNFYQPNGGESVTLNCSVNAAGLAYTVRWYYNGAILSPNTGRYSGGSFGNPSFTISSLQISDSGSYICSASTAAGSRNSSVISLTVQQSLPTVTVSQNYYQPVVGTSVTLNCTVTVTTGISSYTVQWYYNDAVLPITGRFSGGYFGSPSIVISDLQKSDDGSYKCSATNVGGTRNSSVISLNVLQFPPSDVRITPSTLTVDEGASISLRCSATGSPPPTFSWSQGQRSWTGPQLNIPSSSSNDEAVYSCTATNAAGSQTATSAVFVQYLPRVTIPSYTYTGVQGRSIMIPCTYSSSPTAYSITWSKTLNGQTTNLSIPGANNKYSTGSFSVTSGYANLTINNLEVSDEGVYRCSVTNIKGTGSSIETSLTVSYAPQNIAISPSTLITEPEFSNVAMKCTADGSPTPVFSWTHGTELYSGDTLRFDNAPRTRNGVYTCRAVNSIGTSTATVYLNLQYSPDIIATASESTFVASVGSSVTLDCKNDANPVASSFEWTFNGNTFERTEPELVISVTSSSFGSYQCRARNNLGVSAVHDFTLSEAAGDGTGLGNIGLSTGSSGLSAGEIAAIVIALLFIILIIILVLCCCYYQGVCGKKEAKGKIEPEPEPEPIVERKIEIPRFHEVPIRKYPSRDLSFVSRQDVDIGHIREDEFEINRTYKLVPPSSTVGGTIISMKDGHTPRGNKLPALDYTYEDYEQKKRKKKRKKRRHHHRESGEGMESSPRRRRERESHENFLNTETYQSVYDDGDLVVEPGPNNYYYNEYNA